VFGVVWGLVGVGAGVRVIEFVSRRLDELRLATWWETVMIFRFAEISSVITEILLYIVHSPFAVFMATLVADISQSNRRLPSMTIFLSIELTLQRCR
jgi:hypothetical protein